MCVCVCVCVCVKRDGTGERGCNRDLTKQRRKQLCVFILSASSFLTDVSKIISHFFNVLYNREQ